MPAPARTPSPASAPVRTTLPAPAPAPRTAAPAVRLGASAQGINAPSPGEQLPAPVQATLSNTLNVNLSQVRVHTGPSAAAAAQSLSARAFTVGNHIFLGFRERATDVGLMAHEAAHVVQQQGAPLIQRWAHGQNDSFEREAHRASAAALRGESFSVQERTGSPQLQRLGLSDILDGLAELAANLPGYTLLTVIIGRNPINQRLVERNFTNLLRGFMGLILGGEILFQVLNRYGVVQRMGAWVTDQLRTLGITYDDLRRRFIEFTSSLSWTDIFSPGDVWRRAQNIFTDPINRIRSFVSSLISQAITWLKETFMQPLSNFCRQIPGYTLVTVLLGRDPFTNVPVARTALNVVRAFAEFIPGGIEKVNQLVESRALERAHQWFLQETQARNLTWARVTGTFAQAWNSLRLEDVLTPIDTLQRMVNLFRPLMRDFVSFAGAALMKLLEIIFEAVMGAGGARILAILKRARATFLTIIQNPVGFLRNLLAAVGQGVRQFMGNILRHLQQGVIAWLTGPVAQAGIQMPERWDLRGIIWFVLQILGLTWARIRQKLVRLLGERAVAMLEAGFQLIQEIRQRGLVQALRDRVTEFFGQLRDAALGSIRSFIQQRLVMAGITQLLSLLNPVGAVIQAIIKTYTTIQFFIQRINQILDLVESIVNSISAIASGAIGGAASFIERTMARTIPIILDFLARFIGLGDIGGQVQRTIRNLQARVDQMLDRAVDWIRNMARNLLSRALGGDPNATPQQRLDRALTEAQAAVDRYAGRSVGAVILRPLLAAIRFRHQLTSLELVEDGGFWAVEGVINPRRRTPRSRAQVEVTTALPAQVIVGAEIQLVRPGGGVSPHIYRIEVISAPQLEFRYIGTSAPASAATRGTLHFSGYGSRWRLYVPEANFLSMAELLNHNGGPSGTNDLWSDRDIARKVLNYRHWEQQRNPEGKEWEHIMEYSARGPHSVDNLALVDATKNRELGVLYGRPASWRGFPDTGARSIRDYLMAINADIKEHKRWKMHAYSSFFGLRLQPFRNHGRGPYQVLE